MEQVELIEKFEQMKGVDMTENEAKIFIQNAMEQSRKVLAELLLIAPKVFAVRKKSLGEYYSHLENCKKEIQACEVAIKALEDVQQYRALEKHLSEMYAWLIRRLCRAPYDPRDILYVRETWAWCPCWDCGMDGEHGGCEHEAERKFHDEKKEHGCYMYRASCGDDEYPSADTWHPSIHMPKEAARIWLKVTDVRVERLQEITEDGAKAEGAIDNRGFIHSPDNEYDRIHTAREHFVEIWNSTIKRSDFDRYSWDASPWVWVIEFERCEKPKGV